MASVSPARKAAFQILLTVERGQAYADDLLRGKSVDALSAAWIAIWRLRLCWACCAGRFGWTSRFREFIKHPNAKLDAEVRIALRLGAFQLLHLDRVPVHAAIDESVELAKRAGHRFASGMVNAVLRKLADVARSPMNRLLSLTALQGKRFPALCFSIPSAPNAVTELAIAQAHPAWMVERWATFYGMNAARSRSVHTWPDTACVICSHRGCCR